MTQWYPRPADPEVADRLAAAFRSEFGRDPDGVWAAPGRVNLIGEHLDYNGGRCLPFALAHRTFVALGARNDGRLRIRSMQAPASDPGYDGRLDAVSPGAVHGWAPYVVGVPWALRSAGFEMPGFDGYVDGHVPWGAGLSSSAALGCAVAVALDTVAELGLAPDDAGRARLAAAVVHAENEIAQAPTGGLDQSASLRCTEGHALLLDFRDLSAEQVPLDLRAAGAELLVIDTRAHHAHADGGYGSRREQCEQAARVLGLRHLSELSSESLDDATAQLAGSIADPGLAATLAARARHVATESARVSSSVDLIRSRDLRTVGALLSASHRSLRDDFEVSCDELDLACRTADASGAWGSRMVGGGFGGSAIALVPTGTTDDVAAAVEAAFVEANLRRPCFLIAEPSAAAGQV